MFSPRVWLVVTLVLLLVLFLLVIWIFSDLELVFPGNDRVDRSVGKRLGMSVLVGTGLTLVVFAVAVLNIESLRYWAGAGCIVLALLFMFGAIRSVVVRPVYNGSDADDGIVKEITLAEKFLAAYRTQTLRRLSTRFIEIVGVVVIYFYLSGAKYLSLFDLFGLVLLMISTEVKFVAEGVGIRKRLVLLRAEQAKAV